MEKDNLEKFITDQISELEKIHDLYTEINKDRKFDYRLRGIELELNTLYSVLYKASMSDEWIRCYKEDTKE